MEKFRCGCKGHLFKIYMDDNVIREIHCHKCKKIFGLRTEKIKVNGEKKDE